jgi:predicted nuclease of restriction endonuclease-like (RecB) superfamily
MGEKSKPSKKGRANRRVSARSRNSSLAKRTSARPDAGYGRLVSDVAGLLEQARRGAVRAVNAILTATYWEIGRRIVEHEQRGGPRAEYGQELISRLSADLTEKHGRGFSRRNLEQMRAFYLGWEIAQTSSAQFEGRARWEKTGKEPQSRAILQTMSGESPALAYPGAFPLSWSHYVRLLSVRKPHARAFYEAEAIHGGWSVRQLDRQITTQFFERTAGSSHPEALLARHRKPEPHEALTADEAIRDPYLLEFLNLNDEYNESDLEDALVRHLEWFLLELGAGFTFVARQKRIRIGDTWYRIDLLLYHRRLHCLVVIDLKTGAFTHADAGQMNLYLNYAREHLMVSGENDPVGIILCSDKDDAVVKYATGGIRAQVFASKYLTGLPDEETLRREIVTTRRAIGSRLRNDRPA